MSDRAPRNYVRDIAHSVVVPGHRVIRSSEVARIGEHLSHSSEVPVIELVTEDDIVRAIDITCGCGQKTRLWCSYETRNDSPDISNEPQ